MNTLSYNIGGTTTYDSNPSGSYASSSMTATNAPIPVTVDPNYAANPIPVSRAAAGVYDMSSSIPMYSSPQPVATPIYIPSQPQDTANIEMAYQPYTSSVATSAIPTATPVQPIADKSVSISMDSSPSIPSAVAQPVEVAPYTVPAQKVNLNSAAVSMPAASTKTDSTTRPSQVVVPAAVDASQYAIPPAGLKVITLKNG